MYTISVANILSQHTMFHEFSISSTYFSINDLLNDVEKQQNVNGKHQQQPDFHKWTSNTRLVELSVTTDGRHDKHQHKNPLFFSWFYVFKQLLYTHKHEQIKWQSACVPHTTNTDAQHQ